jgi:hypothetical protein
MLDSSHVVLPLQTQGPLVEEGLCDINHSICWRFLCYLLGSVTAKTACLLLHRLVYLAPLPSCRVVRPFCVGNGSLI